MWPYLFLLLRPNENFLFCGFSTLFVLPTTRQLGEFDSIWGLIAAIGLTVATGHLSPFIGDPLAILPTLDREKNASIETCLPGIWEDVTMSAGDLKLWRAVEGLKAGAGFGLGGSGFGSDSNGSLMHTWEQTGLNKYGDLFIDRNFSI